MELACQHPTEGCFSMIVSFSCPSFRTHTRFNLVINFKVLNIVHNVHACIDRQNTEQQPATGSGFLISDRRILTNAHIVSDSKFVSVTKNQSSQHFPAEVSAVGHECDLAVLKVHDDKFWEDAKHLEIADSLPELNDSVVVVGYPIGGRTVCVTKGTCFSRDVFFGRCIWRGVHLLVLVVARD